MKTKPVRYTTIVDIYGMYPHSGHIGQVDTYLDRQERARLEICKHNLLAVYKSMSFQEQALLEKVFELGFKASFIANIADIKEEYPKDEK